MEVQTEKVTGTICLEGPKAGTMLAWSAHKWCLSPFRQSRKVAARGRFPADTRYCVVAFGIRLAFCGGRSIGRPHGKVERFFI
jgi:hypothetical protein